MWRCVQLLCCAELAIMLPLSSSYIPYPPFLLPTPPPPPYPLGPSHQIQCVVETRDREHALSLKKALERKYGNHFTRWGERTPGSIADSKIYVKCWTDQDEL